MSKPLLAPTILLMLCGAASAAPAEPPSEPEHTIDAIGADVTSRAQWFGDTIDHVLTGDEAAKASADEHRTKHEKHPAQ